jgi:hypothetical protein
LPRKRFGRNTLCHIVRSSVRSSSSSSSSDIFRYVSAAHPLFPRESIIYMLFVSRCDMPDEEGGGGGGGGGGGRSRARERRRPTTGEGGGATVSGDGEAATEGAGETTDSVKRRRGGGMAAGLAMTMRQHGGPAREDTLGGNDRCG